MPDESDNTCTIARLLDENQQLRDENRQLRDDYEHLVNALNRVQVEALS